MPTVPPEVTPERVTALAAVIAVTYPHLYREMRALDFIQLVRATVEAGLILDAEQELAPGWDDDLADVLQHARHGGRA